jgi:hypothetical protein
MRRLEMGRPCHSRSVEAVSAALEAAKQKAPALVLAFNAAVARGAGRTEFEEIWTGQRPARLGTAMRQCGVEPSSTPVPAAVTRASPIVFDTSRPRRRISLKRTSAEQSPSSCAASLTPRQAELLLKVSRTKGAYYPKYEGRSPGKYAAECRMLEGLRRLRLIAHSRPDSWDDSYTFGWYITDLGKKIVAARAQSAQPPRQGEKQRSLSTTEQRTILTAVCRRHLPRASDKLIKAVVQGILDALGLGLRSSGRPRSARSDVS